MIFLDEGSSGMNDLEVVKEHVYIAFIGNVDVKITTFGYRNALEYGTLRDKKAWSQAELADNSGVSRVMVGKYERGEDVPSIEAAKKTADALEVSLDHHVGEGALNGFDKKTFRRLQDLELLEEEKKKTLFYLIDTYIRDAKARKAYAH